MRTKSGRYFPNTEVEAYARVLGPLVGDGRARRVHRGQQGLLLSAAPVFRGGRLARRLALAGRAVVRQDRLRRRHHQPEPEPDLRGQRSHRQRRGAAEHARPALGAGVHGARTTRSTRWACWRCRAATGSTTAISFRGWCTTGASTPTPSTAMPTTISRTAPTTARPRAPTAGSASMRTPPSTTARRPTSRRMAWGCNGPTSCRATGCSSALRTTRAARTSRRPRGKAIFNPNRSVLQDDEDELENSLLRNDHHLERVRDRHLHDHAQAVPHPVGTLQQHAGGDRGPPEPRPAQPRRGLHLQQAQPGDRPQLQPEPGAARPGSAGTRATARPRPSSWVARIPNNPCTLPNALASDPFLEQVVSQTFELGARGRLDNGLQWSAAAYRSNNTDDILFVSTSATGTSAGYFTNFGKTRRQGIELGLGGQWRWLSWSRQLRLRRCDLPEQRLPAVREQQHCRHQLRPAARTTSWSPPATTSPASRRTSST